MSAVSAPPAPTLRLGVLDTTSILSDQTVEAALKTTLTLAERADALGYSRFWIGEHHSPWHGQSSPEVLLPLLAALTSRLRVGTAGVLMAFHSPYKVAQNFLLLESLFPGRIDLGLARGSVSPSTARALLSGRPAALEPECYAAVINELLGWLNGAGPERIAPHRSAPEPWILGSSGATVMQAAKLGTAFSLALFFGGDSDSTIVQRYRENFRPSARVCAPICNIAVAGVCADSELEARRLADAATKGGLITHVAGTSAQCHEQLLALADRYGVDEVIFRDVSPTSATKLRSYELLPERFRLPILPCAASLRCSADSFPG